MPELGRCRAGEAGLGSRGVATASPAIAIPLHCSQPPGRRSGGGGGGGAGVLSAVPLQVCVWGQCPMPLAWGIAGWQGGSWGQSRWGWGW